MAARVRRVLDDLDLNLATWSVEDLRDYLGDALAAVSAHTARESLFEQELTADTASLALPDDFLDPGPIWLSNGSTRQLLSPAPLRPGETLPDSEAVGDESDFYWWPEGTINFFRQVASGNTLRVHYWAYWSVPSEPEAEEVIPIPRWLESPVKWNMLMQAMTKPGAQAAYLAQFKTKRDSGDPEDNPLIVSARFYKRLYDGDLAEKPPQNRKGWRPSQ
jgi:hypothetical protein